MSIHTKFHSEQRFFCIKDSDLHNMSLGSDGKCFEEGLKSVRGCIKRLHNHKWERFTIYTYTNFYDDNTFVLQYSNL